MPLSHCHIIIFIFRIRGTNVARRVGIRFLLRSLTVIWNWYPPLILVPPPSSFSNGHHSHTHILAWKDTMRKKKSCVRIRPGTIVWRVRFSNFEFYALAGRENTLILCCRFSPYRTGGPDERRECPPKSPFLTSKEPDTIHHENVPFSSKNRRSVFSAWDEY